MTDQKDWVSILQGIVQQMAVADVTDLEIQRGDLRVRLRREPEGASTPAEDAATGDVVVGDARGLHRVTAPLTGVLYTAASPTSKPHVAVGDWVEPDTVVALIEAMKVFNQVTADCRGRVAAVLARQGQLLHTGEPILLVDTGAAPDHPGEVAS